VTCGARLGHRITVDQCVTVVAVNCMAIRTIELPLSEGVSRVLECVGSNIPVATCAGLVLGSVVAHRIVSAMDAVTIGACEVRALVVTATPRHAHGVVVAIETHAVLQVRLGVGALTEVDHCLPRFTVLKDLCRVIARGPVAGFTLESRGEHGGIAGGKG
jgi:hypothetical protein